MRHKNVADAFELLLGEVATALEAVREEEAPEPVASSTPNQFHLAEDAHVFARPRRDFDLSTCRSE